MPVYLAIDAGTTRLKAALVDENGGRLAMAACNVTVERPFEGAHEIDMDMLWLQLCDILSDIRKSAPALWQDISGIGICAQGDGMWAIDEYGKPVGRAILWNDTRSREFETERDDKLNELLVRHHSTALFAGAFPVILKWMQQHAHIDYSRIAHVFHCKDWLNYKLTGSVASDYTDRSTAGIDIFSKRYVHALFDMLGLEDIQSALAPIYPSTHIVGRITKEASAQTGLREHIPVITGCIDVAAVAMGVGMKEPGDACIILGTTLCYALLLNERQVDIHDRNGSALCSVLPERFNRVMAALSGTSALDWAKDLLYPELSYEELSKLMQTVQRGSNGVIFHPYINGERAPFRDPFASGSFLGLRAQNTKADMLRAAYEGVAFSLRDCSESVPPAQGNLYITGGGAKSDFTCTLIADTLQKTVLRPKESELGILGIARTVHMALGHVGANLSEYDVFSPNQEAKAELDGAYRRFCDIRRALPPFWKARFQG